jgi:hypothetical protein
MIKSDGTFSPARALQRIKNPPVIASGCDDYAGRNDFSGNLLSKARQVPFHFQKRLG